MRDAPEDRALHERAEDLEAQNARYRRLLEQASAPTSCGTGSETSSPRCGR